MSESIIITAKILPVILLIILGYILQASHYIQVAAINGIKKIAINITLPLMIFLSLVELDFKSSYLAIVGIIFGICILLLLAGMLIKKLSGSPNRYLPVLFTSFENGMIGYGILAAMMGINNIYPIIILDMGQTLFFSLVFVTLMQALNNNTVSPVGLILGFIKNPYVWATVAALTLKGTGAIYIIREMPLLNAFFECFRMLANITTPVMCLAIGYELKIDLKHLAKPLGVVALRMVLLLSVAALFNELVVTRLFHLEKIFTTAVYTMFMLPPFFVGSLLIRDEAEEEKHFAVNVISINILVFLVLFTFLTVTGKIL
jgi:predicted permease